MKKILPGLLTTLILATLWLSLPKPTLAAGNLYFSPGSGTKYNGQNFTVSVRASGMDGVDAVNASFTYPADKLTFVSVSSGSSAWDVKAEESGGNGNVTIQRGSTSSLTGDKLVANVTFKPKVNTGTAVLSFAADAALTRAGSNVISGKSSATYTLAQPAAAPPPPAADTTAPVISAIGIMPTTDLVTVTWKTNEASDSNVDYGTDQGYFVTTGSATLVTDHSVTLNSKFIEPGSTYHLIVRSKDASGNEVKSADQTFTTLGYDLVVTLKDENGVILANTKATLYSKSQTATSDSNGVVTFNNVSPGEHIIVVEIGDQKLAKTLEVKNAGAKEVKTKDKTGKETTSLKTEPQKFDVKIAAASTTTQYIRLLGMVLIILGTLTFCAIGFIYLRKKLSPKQ